MHIYSWTATFDFRLSSYLFTVAYAFDLLGLRPFATATNLQNFNYIKKCIIALTLDSSFCSFVSGMKHIIEVKNFSFLVFI